MTISFHGMSKLNFQDISLAVLIIVVIVLFSYLLTEDILNDQKPLLFLVTGLQVFVSAAFGRIVIPKIFGNNELLNYQRAVAQNIFHIFGANSRDQANGLIRTAIIRDLRPIPPRIIREEIASSGQAIATLFGELVEGDYRNVSILDDKIEILFGGTSEPNHDQIAKIEDNTANKLPPDNNPVEESKPKKSDPQKSGRRKKQ